MIEVLPIIGKRMSSSTEITLGGWVKSQRAAQKLSLRKLAALAGISHVSIDKVEKGGSMHDDTLKMVAYALAGEGATETEKAAKFQEARLARAGMAPQISDAEAQELLKDILSLGPEDREMVRGLGGGGDRWVSAAGGWELAPPRYLRL